MEFVKFFIANCDSCAVKQTQCHVARLKPITSSHFMDRMQVSAYLHFTTNWITKKFECKILLVILSCSTKS